MTTLDLARTRPAHHGIGQVLRTLWRWIATLLLFAGAWIMIFPFLWMVSSSVKPTDEIFDPEFSLIPITFVGFDNYFQVLFEQPYLLALFNSLVVCIGVLVVQLITAIPAAYALAKLKFRGANILFGAVLLGITIPINVISIPLYMAVVKVGLLDTYLSIMLPSLVSVFAIFLFRQFFAAYPYSSINAARIDGLTEIEIVLRLIVPAAMPAIAAFSIFSFVAHWNELYWPLIVIQSQEKMTVTLTLMQYRSEFDSNFGGAFAAATVTTAPLIIAFLLARRHFIRGITMTGIKG